MAKKIPTNERRNVLISTMVTKDMRRRIDALCKKDGRTVSTWTERAIIEKVEAEEAKAKRAR